MNRRFVFWSLAGAAAALSGCAPVFSELQSARLVGRKHVEVTASASQVSLSHDEFADGDDNDLSDNFGVQLAAGITDRVDARLRYERVDIAGDTGGLNVLGFGPKVGIVRNWVAAYVPVGFAFGELVQEESRTWQVHPTLLLTLPLHRNVEVNASAKYMIPFDDELHNTVALNFGLGLGRLDRWTIRPEVGFLFDPGEEGHLTQFSLGFSFRPR